MKRPLEGCPNCGSIWGVGSEEWEWQQCDACGWPDPDMDFEKDDWPEDDDDCGPNDPRCL